MAHGTQTLLRYANTASLPYCIRNVNTVSRTLQHPKLEQPSRMAVVRQGVQLRPDPTGRSPSAKTHSLNSLLFSEKPGSMLSIRAPQTSQVPSSTITHQTARHAQKRPDDPSCPTMTPLSLRHLAGLCFLTNMSQLGRSCLWRRGARPETQNPRCRVDPLEPPCEPLANSPTPLLRYADAKDPGKGTSSRERAAVWDGRDRVSSSGPDPASTRRSVVPPSQPRWLGDCRKTPLRRRGVGGA